MKMRSAVFPMFLLLAIVSAAQIPTSTTTVIPSTFFGLHYYYANLYPVVSFGSMRLWDTNATRWQVMNPSAGTYSFTKLDQVLLAVKTATYPTDVLLSLGGTPQFISSDSTNSGCEYDPPHPGSCGVPTDIAASCTNVNGNNNCDGKTDGTNQTWRDYMYALAHHISQLSNSYQKVTSIEIWNEFTAQGSGPTYPAWEGTDAQLVRMAQDANCIFTGRGTGCTAANMGVTAVGILPTVLVTTPNGVMEQSPENTNWGTYVGTTGALSNVDVAAVHTYTGSPSPTVAEKVATMYTSTNGYLVTAGSSCTDIPCWSTEGSWGTNASLEPNLDLQAAFVARYYLVGWASGFQRMYWYNYSASNVGTLWVANGSGGCMNANGCLTKAGTAYQTIYGWMVGQTMSTLCSNGSGTIWTCGLETGSNPAALVVWDTSKTCSTSCTTGPYTITAGQYSSYNSLDGTNTLISHTATTVPVGAKPIELVP